MTPPPFEPGSSRAIRIPMHTNSNSTDMHTSTRRNRMAGRRHSKAGRADNSDNTHSTFHTPESWNSSPASTSDVSNNGNLRNAIASPSRLVPSSNHTSTDVVSSQQKDKQRAISATLPPTSTLPPLFQTSQSPLGPSMLSSSSYKSINLNSHLGSSDEPARLITYTKHSQGFTWNDELFLPSYLVNRHRYSGGQRDRYRRSGGRGTWDDEDDDDVGDFAEDGERCPVTDIFVTDEEAAAMMP